MRCASRSIDRRKNSTRSTPSARQISGLLDIDEILTLVVSAAVNLTGAEQGSLMLHDPLTGELYLRAQYNLSSQNGAADCASESTTP